jgi:site-specific recombinase XerD
MVISPSAIVTGTRSSLKPFPAKHLRVLATLRGSTPDGHAYTTLRHADATHSLRAGLTAHAVTRLLGHSDAGLVWRRYGHALPDELLARGRHA